MVKAHKVRLYIRVRRPDGRDSFTEPFWNRNRTLRAGYALIEGRPEHYPEGVYYLCFLRNGKRVWEAVGSDADAAIVAFRNKEHDLRAISLGRSTLSSAIVEMTAAQTDVALSLEDAIDSYLEEVRRFRSAKTISACENMLGRFSAALPGKPVREISRKDLLDHMAALKEEGLGDRTIFNHIGRINTLLKANGVGNMLKAADKPKYDEKDVTAYNSDELAALFSAATPEERILFEFFLGTGFREQEVMYCTWANVDLRNRVVSVWSKPELGFRVKDKEERSVPVPDSLIASLAERKKRSTSMLIFPGRNGSPDGHFLRTLQKLAFRAELNCGECVNKQGKRCSEHPVCSAWGLHKFRRTFATMHSEAGVSPPTIQRWLSHADLSTTLRYLAVADLRSERTRSQVNASFAALAPGGAA